MAHPRLPVHRPPCSSQCGEVHGASTRTPKMSVLGFEAAFRGACNRPRSQRMNSTAGTLLVCDLVPRHGAEMDGPNGTCG